MSIRWRKLIFPLVVVAFWGQIASFCMRYYENYRNFTDFTVEIN